MKSRIISIIVPVYNGEKTIGNCLRSILSQNIQKMEVIVVNDGSEDDTLKNLEVMAKRDQRIKIIDQNNCGVSKARNRGIEEARGKYIMFVDADDELEQNSLCSLLRKMEKGNFDFLIANYKKIFKFSNGKKREIIPKQRNTIYRKNDEIWKNMTALLHSGIINSPCGRLYKRSIIIENDIRMDIDLSVGEDLQFNLEYLEYINTLEVDAEIIYKYNSFNSTLTNSYKNEMFEERLKSIKLLCNHFKRHDLNFNLIFYLYEKLFFASIIQEIKYKKNLLQRKEFILGLLNRKETDNFVKSFIPYGTISRIMYIFIRSRNYILIDLIARCMFIIKKHGYSYVQRISV